MEKGKDITARSNGNGYPIMEVLFEVNNLLREELRKQLLEENNHEIQFLLEAQLNISRAVEALYDRSLYKPID